MAGRPRPVDQELRGSGSHIYHEELTSAEPDFALYRSELASTCLWLAELRLDHNEPDEAKALIERAGAAFEELAARGIDETVILGGRVRCTLLKARLYSLTNPSRGMEEASKAVRQLDELSKRFSTEPRERTADDMYVLAVARALHKESKDATLRSLKAAVNNYTFRNFARLRLDVAFRSLSNDPEFQKAVAELEKEAKLEDKAGEEESEASSRPKP